MSGVSQNLLARWRLGANSDPRIIPINIGSKTIASVPTTEHTIWPGATTTTPGLNQFAYSTSVDITHAVSSAGDVGPLRIEGLRGDGSLSVQTIPAMTGQTPVPLSEPIMHANSVLYPLGGNVGRISLIKGTDVTAGVPNNDADVMAIIEPTEGISKQAVYRIPLGYKCSLLGGYVQLFSTLGASTTAIPAWGGGVSLGGTAIGGFINAGDLELSQSHYRHDENYDSPLPFSELDTFEIRVKGVSSAAVAVRARMFAWIMRNDV